MGFIGVYRGGGGVWGGRGPGRDWIGGLMDFLRVPLDKWGGDRGF